MTYNQEYERVLENDVTAVADFLFAFDANGKNIYTDPLLDMFRKVMQNQEQDPLMHTKTLSEFNKATGAKLINSDVDIMMSQEDMSFNDFLVTHLRQKYSSGLIDYCEEAFIKAVQTIPNNSIKRNTNDPNIELYNCASIPKYINKYYSDRHQGNLQSIKFIHGNFTEADCSEFPFAVAVEFSNCQLMTTLTIPTQEEIVVMGNSFTKLNVIKNDKLTVEDISVEIDVQRTMITSMNDINIHNENECIYKIIMPKSITTLERDTPFPDTMPITYLFVTDSKLNSFYGLRKIDTIRCKIATAHVLLDDMIDNQRSMELSFPKLPNAAKKWKTYKALEKKYENLLTNKLMEFAYKASNPESVEEFEYYLKRYTSYNADPKDIALLIDLLRR
jgi:hypothetical protein